MTRSLILLALLVLLTLPAWAVDLPAAGYINTFGWGTICISDRGYPAFDTFDPSLYRYENGIFKVKQGATDIHMRVLLKDGKTYGSYIAACKAANAAKMKTFKNNAQWIRIWASHDDNGQQLYKTWPAPLAKPDWNELMDVEPNATTELLSWVGQGFKADQIQESSMKLKWFLERAKPGYRFYVAQYAGFVRDAPELKFWDKDNLKWMIPIEYVSGAPVAAGTAEVVAE